MSHEMTESQRQSNWKWWTLCGLFAVCPVLAGGAYFLARGNSSTEAPSQEGPPDQSAAVPVEVIQPRKGAMDRTTSQPGSVHAFESVELFAGASGYLKTLKVDIGSLVKKDQVLARVDVPELDKQVQRRAAGVDQAKARVRQMKARVVSTEADLEVAKAVVPQAEAWANSRAARLRFRQMQLARMRELAGNHSIEMRIVDEHIQQRDDAREAEISAKEAVTSARARVISVTAKIEEAKADVQEAEAEVKVAQAEFEKAQELVKLATVLAPFDGIVVQRSVFEHSYVRAANEGGTQPPLLTVQRTDKMRVVVQIPDRDVPYCDPGDPAVVEIDALPGKKLPAVVSRIGASEDPDTRLMHVEIDLPNPTGKIRDGMYGRVTIILEKSDLLTIPSSCLVGKPDGKNGNVYVVRDGQATLTPVTLGPTAGQQVAILNGLTANDQIIRHPRRGVSDGSSVIVSPSEAPGNAAPGR